ncbi:hypothetical protein [Alicyclobacillus sp. SO9]|uniref:hypothetical protein n=1 Tax=Alicyclobacillus sp. SO9 TaxID=2665646 RepID=UPI0018E739E8|nr:hypothetical protein [Alicyclobacillus sp. SO9]
MLKNLNVKTSSLTSTLRICNGGGYKKTAQQGLQESINNEKASSKDWTQSGHTNTKKQAVKKMTVDGATVNALFDTAKQSYSTFEWISNKHLFKLTYLNSVNLPSAQSDIAVLNQSQLS